MTSKLELWFFSLSKNLSAEYRMCRIWKPRAVGWSETERGCTGDVHLLPFPIDTSGSSKISCSIELPSTRKKSSPAKSPKTSMRRGCCLLHHCSSNTLRALAGAICVGWSACGRREVQVSLKTCLDQAQRQAGSEVKAETRPQLRYSKDMTVMQRFGANLVSRP